MNWAVMPPLHTFHTRTPNTCAFTLAPSTAPARAHVTRGGTHPRLEARLCVREEQAWCPDGRLLKVHVIALRKPGLYTAQQRSKRPHLEGCTLRSNDQKGRAEGGDTQAGEQGPMAWSSTSTDSPSLIQGRTPRAPPPPRQIISSDHRNKCCRETGRDRIWHGRQVSRKTRHPGGVFSSIQGRMPHPPPTPLISCPPFCLQIDMPASPPPADVLCLARQLDDLCQAGYGCPPSPVLLAASKIKPLCITARTSLASLRCSRCCAQPRA
eukprot:356621-Chlamydomonas_euryale.AAC.2